jgi:DUF4097 and DUF4098 domain-containing protein YvlB
MTKILPLILCLAPAAFPQEKRMTCDEGRSRDTGHYCEIREVTIPATARLEVDGGTNGGISVAGAGRSDILVRAKVQTNQNDEADSRRLAAAIHVETAGGNIRASGPSEWPDHHGWSVSYEILVPRRTSLALRTNNGGIHISSVQGQIQFEAVNGGVTLKQLAGSVEGHTTNGGLHLELASDHWEGDRCDISTTNGGVTIQVPSNYSAHLETGTVNGGIRMAFPVTVEGEINSRIAVDLGAGGNLVRATTTNGGVRVERSM